MTQHTARLLVSAGLLLAVLCVAGWWLFLRPIHIDSPCTAFVTTFSGTGQEMESPRLQPKDGELLLAVPFTPAKGDATADALVRGLRLAPRKLVITDTGRELRGYGITTSGEMLLVVDSAGEAETILKELCFTSGQLAR